MSRRLERLWYPPAGEGLARRAVYGPLTAASYLFRAAVGLRNALYDAGALEAARVEGPRVVSVGNLNVGGAGKTPAVIHLAGLAARAGRRVVVLSRGHGRRSDEDRVLVGGAALPPASDVGDEPLLIARRCPGVTLMVGTDRARLARRARDELGAEVILLDDGLQHRRLARDVECVVVDEAVGFGNGELLPRGPLREPISALRRADLIWLRLSEEEPAALPKFEAPIVRARHRVASLVGPDGRVHSADELRGREVLALAALARPGAFLRTLERLGMRVAERRLFPDHHPFTAAELAEVEAAARRAELPVVTTEKDEVRLPEGFGAWKARLEVEVAEGEELLRAAIGI